MTIHKNSTFPPFVANLLGFFFPFSLTNQEEEKAINNLNQFLQEAFDKTTKETHKFLENTTDKTGQTLKFIAKNPVVKTLKHFPGTSWLMTFLGEIDLPPIQAKVKQLKEKYPEETPEQLTHRVMVQTAWEAGKIGLITNIIPPVAVAMLGIELIATAKLQAEMVYQIAAVYGLDLEEPARRGEVLAIFGLSLGTDVLTAGLNLIEIIPGVGAVVGASSNAALLYGLGYTACRFYQEKCRGSSQSLTLQDWQNEEKAYWRSALTQSRIMDQILVHMVVASYPNKSWSEILPTLEAVSPSSAKVVATHLEHPQPLDQLLDQLSPDFAPLLLRRCYCIAQLDGVVSHEEQQILDAIDQKFDIDFDAFVTSFQEEMQAQ